MVGLITPCQNGAAHSPPLFLTEKILNVKYILSFFMAIAVLAATTVKSQTPVFAFSKDYKLTVSDTTIDADTTIVYFDQTQGSGLKSIDVYVKKTSGTLSGKMYIEGSSNGWLTSYKLDSLSVTDTTYQRHTDFSSTSYLSYRVWYHTPGATQRSVLYAALLRRPDDN